MAFIVFTIAWPFISDALKKRKTAKAPAGDSPNTAESATDCKEGK